MQAKTSFFIALFLILFLQTAIASRVLADADAGPDQTVNEGDTVYLDGSGSTPEDDDDDDDDKIQSYLWEQVKGKPKVILTGADQAIASFIAPQVSRDRRLTFKLTVRFASGSKDTDETKVKVLDDNNDPPTADAGPDQNVDEETTVTLDGSNSSDPDDGIESYLWKQT
ncbi:MAG: PKD domain-containing protein, partial [Syntrophobacteria bacterium]